MDREKKRESAKKSKNFSVYSKKAVRAKELLIAQKTMSFPKYPDNGPKPGTH